MSLVESLSKAQIFNDLSRDELEQIAALCEQRTYDQQETILSEGDASRELYVIARGTVEVSLSTPEEVSTPLINLGAGQVFGEMSLVDQGARSATVKAVSEGTMVNIIPHEDFLQLCREDNHIGFIVMRNLAAEMSLKLRFHNIAEQMAGNK